MFTGFFSFLSPTAAKISGWLIAALTAIPLMAKFFVVSVEQGEYGYFLRCGRPRVLKNGQVKLAEPGVYFVAPIWRQIKIVNTKEIRCDAIAQTVTTADEVVVEINFTARYRRLTDADSMTRSILEVDNLTGTVVDIITAVVATQVSKLTFEVLRNLEALIELIESSLEEVMPPQCGAEIKWLGIQSFGKTDAQLRFEGQCRIADAIRRAEPDVMHAAAHNDE